MKNSVIILSWGEIVRTNSGSKCTHIHRKHPKPYKPPAGKSWSPLSFNCKAPLLIRFSQQPPQLTHSGMWKLCKNWHSQLNSNAEECWRTASLYWTIIPSHMIFRLFRLSWRNFAGKPLQTHHTDQISLHDISEFLKEIYSWPSICFGRRSVRTYNNSSLGNRIDFSVKALTVLSHSEINVLKIWWLLLK